jgi:hypothetical protein
MKLAIVTTCTASKTTGEAAGPELREVPPHPDAAARAAAWTQVLMESPVAPKRVRDLYQGGHWQASLKALEVARAQRCWSTELWVLSAGYGLLSTEHDVIKPYNATFATPPKSHRQDAPPNNTIALGIDGKARLTYNRAWWDALSALRPAGQGQPRTLFALSKQLGEDGAMLVIASDAYLAVVAEDLRQAATRLRPERLVVLSAGVLPSTRRQLDKHLILLDACFRNEVGGGLAMLNARTAAWLLARVTPECFTRDKVQAEVFQAMERLAPVETPIRKKLSDEAVMAYIREAVGPNGQLPACSPLHVRFRRDGLACSAERFQGLYERVQLDGLSPRTAY